MATANIKGFAALNVYKKVALVRSSNDKLTFEDENGKIQIISDFGDAASTSTPTLQQRAKIDIPTPKILTVENYEKDIPPTHRTPKSYIRYKRQDYDEQIEYVADAEDEEWYKKTRFAPSEKDQNRPVLPLDVLEQMLDAMEKLTGFETIVTKDHAEKTIMHQIPVLERLFPRTDVPGSLTPKHVVNDVYAYWVQKRSKLKRPLLRRFWPVTASDDTNPHLVFRPREKEKYKLRKKRQNDMDAFRKMKQLRNDFARVRVLLDLVCRREKLNRLIVEIQADWFKQRLVDIVDTSGSDGLQMPCDRNELNKMMEVPTYFDVAAFGSTGQKKKRRRKTGEFDGSRGPSPIADVGRVDGDRGVRGSSQPPALVVAGQNHGEPAPNFLHPLKSRQSFVTSWDNTVPFITSYVDSHPVPTFRFRHRPRIGRGGRLVIDRLPQPIYESDSQISVFTAGKGMVRSVEPRARLLDLKAEPLDHAALSQKIEEICASALKDEHDTALAALNGQMTHDTVENDGDEVLVRVEDWMSTDDQVWGEERYAIGPI